jgi:hypothetical protein
MILSNVNIGQAHQQVMVIRYAQHLRLSTIIFKLLKIM